MIKALKSLNLSQDVDECKWSGAVNFLFVRNYLLLIKRSETMPTHAGQVAFVGGHKAQNDQSPIMTALRELEEETGIKGNSVETIGVINPVLTSKKQSILPVISYIDCDPIYFLENIKSNGEWDDAYLVPINYLKDKTKWSFGKAISLEDEYKIRFCPLVSLEIITKSGEAKKDLLWGATARMIWNFFKYHYDNGK